MKKNGITIYYVCLVLVTAFQVLTTVFQGSLLVHQGYKIAQLHDAQDDLKKQQETLELALYNNQSIDSVEKSPLLAGFEPVASVIAVSDQTSRVADSSL